MEACHAGTLCVNGHGRYLPMPWKLFLTFSFLDVP